MITPYTFKATLHHVWDGDTIWLIVDRGEGWQSKGKYRLFGVDTPEIRGKGVTDEEKAYAQDAKAFVETSLSGAQLIVSTHKGKSKYDWLVEIWFNTFGSVDELSKLLIDNGHGVLYKGGTKKPWAERKALQDAIRARL